jgi:hypothetical protein
MLHQVRHPPIVFALIHLLYHHLLCDFFQACWPGKIQNPDLIRMQHETYGRSQYGIPHLYLSDSFACLAHAILWSTGFSYRPRLEIPDQA